MSSTDEKGSTVPPEAIFFNMETKLQYEDANPLPLLVEYYMMSMTVNQVKEGLLKLDLMNFVTEPSQNLKMCLLLPAPMGSEEDILKDLDGDTPMKNYRDDITRCKMFKMLKV